MAFANIATSVGIYFVQQGFWHWIIGAVLKSDNMTTGTSSNCSLLLLLTDPLIISPLCLLTAAKFVFACYGWYTVYRDGVMRAHRAGHTTPAVVAFFFEMALTEWLVSPHGTIQSLQNMSARFVVGHGCVLLMQDSMAQLSQIMIKDLQGFELTPREDLMLELISPTWMIRFIATFVIGSGILSLWRPSDVMTFVEEAWNYQKPDNFVTRHFGLNGLYLVWILELIINVYGSYDYVRYTVRPTPRFNRISKAFDMTVCCFVSLMLTLNLKSPLMVWRLFRTCGNLLDCDKRFRNFIVEDMFWTTIRIMIAGNGVVSLLIQYYQDS